MVQRFHLLVIYVLFDGHLEPFSTVRCRASDNTTSQRLLKQQGELEVFGFPGPLCAFQKLSIERYAYIKCKTYTSKVLLIQEYGGTLV